MTFRIFIIFGTLLTACYMPVRGVSQPVKLKENEYSKTAENTRQFTVVENDTLQYQINLVLNNAGIPQYFYRNIFTPVCYTNECKPVYINFYWDLLGNYLRYEMPEGKILTKVDHDAFEEADYQKLADILSRSNSIFANLRMEDLLTQGTDSLTNDVDSKTGATLKTIKNDVIDGAVYTCFTLWHIAYGKQVISEMLRITDAYLDHNLLHIFLRSNNFHYQYRAMDEVIDPSGVVKKTFEADIENLIAGKNLFTARTALQKTSADFFNSLKRQEWLWKVKQTVSYPMQVAILKKMAELQIQPVILQQITEDISQYNSEQFKLILAILGNQKTLPDKTIQVLAQALTRETDAEEVYKLLKKHPSNHPTVRAKLNQFENDQSN